MTQYRILLLASLFFAPCAFFTVVVWLIQGHHPCRCLIPEGYVGWVRVDYQIKGAPELPIEEGYRVYKFPDSGQLQTSSAFEVGTYADLIFGREDEFYYYSSDTRRRLPAGANGADGGMIWRQGRGEMGSGMPPAEIKIKESYEFFFVGTEEEYKKYGVKNFNIENGPKVGSISALPKK
jgi:hypothetical protein